MVGGLYILSKRGNWYLSSPRWNQIATNFEALDTYNNVPRGHQTDPVDTDTDGRRERISSGTNDHALLSPAPKSAICHGSVSESLF